MNYSDKKLQTLHEALTEDAALFTPAEFSKEESERTGASNYSYWKSTLRTFSSPSRLSFCVQSSRLYC